MTLEEAIKNLRKQLAIRLGNMNLTTAIKLGDKRVEAIELGIEALERINNIRNAGNVMPGSLLPGEMPRSRG